MNKQTLLLVLLVILTSVLALGVSGVSAAAGPVGPVLEDVDISWFYVNGRHCGPTADIQVTNVPSGGSMRVVFYIVGGPCDGIHIGRTNGAGDNANAVGATTAWVLDSEAFAYGRDLRGNAVIWTPKRFKEGIWGVFKVVSAGSTSSAQLCVSVTIGYGKATIAYGSVALDPRNGYIAFYLFYTTPRVVPPIGWACRTGYSGAEQRTPPLIDTAVHGFWFVDGRLYALVQPYDATLGPLAMVAHDYKDFVAQNIPN